MESVPQHTTKTANSSHESSDELFKLLIQSVRDYSIFVLDAHGKVATWNPGAEKIKGYRPHEIIGQPYDIFFSPEDREAGKPHFILSQAKKHGFYHDDGWRMRKDGTMFWASASVTALTDESGTFRGYAKVTHDDTYRHQAAEELRRSEERFRLAISALREHAFYMLDSEGVVQSWNAGAERHKGYTAEEIIGQNFSVFFTDDDKVSGKPKRELAVAKSMGSFEEEGWRVRKDGSRFWAAVVITAVHDAEGELRGFVKVTRDETAKHEASVRLQQALERARVAEISIRNHAAELEKRVTERTELLAQQTQELTRTNADLEQFAFIASHDLKEPLRMISSYLDLLFTRYGTNFDERAKGYANKVLNATDRMRQLVDAVLEYSRSNGGMDATEVINLEQIIQDAITNHGAEIQRTGTVVERTALPTVRANRIHLTRVFQNLIANAVKFHVHEHEPPHITISADQGDDNWTITVSDNGIGIDKTLHPRLFKIFQRLHTNDEYPGTGIGLATCKRIIEQHGGHIWIEPHSGRGTIFKFTLPLLM